VAIVLQTNTDEHRNHDRRSHFSLVALNTTFTANYAEYKLDKR